VAGGEGVEARDLITLVVDGVGAVVATEVIWDPYRLVDPDGEVVAAVSGFLHELQASGRTSATQRSYALDLLRWFRCQNQRRDAGADGGGGRGRAGAGRRPRSEVTVECSAGVHPRAARMTSPRS
jgi:hypothetical protein